MAEAWEEALIPARVLRSTLYATKVSLKPGCLSESHQGMVVEVPGLPVLLGLPSCVHMWGVRAEGNLVATASRGVRVWWSFMNS